MITVLVVEDSKVVRDFLVHILGEDPQLKVIGTASDGEEGVQEAVRLKPQVITMDANMPRMNGYEAIQKIMEVAPAPIVVVSASRASGEVELTFRALEAGALAAVGKPAGLGHPDHESSVRELVKTIKLMSEVKVVRRRPKPPRPLRWPGSAPPVFDLKPDANLPEIRLIAIGASTGGPQVLATILSGLPRRLAVPILIVQHIATGFTRGFVEWLQNVSGLPIRLAEDRAQIVPGNVYVAPDGHHLEVRTGGRLALTQGEPEHGVRPSISCLFRSVAAVYGESAAGVLLTGMGSDGAEELKLMKDRGSMTLAQDRESSIVFGMPGEAVRLGAATFVLSPCQIAQRLAAVTARSGKD